jgi:hypothetical protein
MGFREFIERTPLGQWTTPVDTTICDFRLGLLYWILTLVFVIGGIVTVTGPSGYYKQDTASIDGSKLVSVWFEGNDDMKNVTQGSADYCDPSAMSTYDYYYYPGNTTVDDRFFFDTNNLCRPFMLGEVALKPGDGGAFVTTFIKETHSLQGSCTGANSVETCNADDDDQFGSFAIPLTPDVDVSSDSCKCEVMQNFFVLGAEKVKVAFSHKFDVGPVSVFGDAAGIAASVTGHRHEIHTTFMKDGEVYKRKSDGQELKFEPGDSIGPVLSVEDYLDLAGLSNGLETRNDGVIPSARPVSDLQPTMRSTGVIVTVNLDYRASVADDGSINEGHVDCIVTAEASRGWNNMGYIVAYITQRTLSEDSVDEELSYRYRRGVSVQFKAAGTISKWDARYAFEVAVDLVVIITMILPLLVKMIATYFLVDITTGKRDKTSMKMYTHVLNHKFNRATTKAKIAAQTLVAASIFKTADTDTNLVMSASEAMQVFVSAGMENEMARALAARLVGTSESNGQIDLMTLAELISSGEVAVEDVAKDMAIKHKLEHIATFPADATPTAQQQEMNEFVLVTLPPGSKPGGKVMIQLPDGRRAEVVVPQNAGPGSQLKLAVPKGARLDAQL